MFLFLFIFYFEEHIHVDSITRPELLFTPYLFFVDCITSYAGLIFSYLFLYGVASDVCHVLVLRLRSDSQVDVLADLRPPEPPFGLAIVQSVKTAYFSQYKACQSLGIKPQVRRGMDGRRPPTATQSNTNFV